MARSEINRRPLSVRGVASTMKRSMRFSAMPAKARSKSSWVWTGNRCSCVYIEDPERRTTNFRAPSLPVQVTGAAALRLTSSKQAKRTIARKMGNRSAPLSISP
jgi:hypothetical protein